MVLLLTDLSNFRASNNDEKDKRQYNNLEFAEEAKYYGRENVKGRPIIHLRSADDVRCQLVPASDVIRNNSSSGGLRIRYGRERSDNASRGKVDNFEIFLNSSKVGNGPPLPFRQYPGRVCDV